MVNTMKSTQQQVTLVTDTELNIGDKVRWKSQANGNFTMKEGEVIAVVPPGVIPAGFSTGWTKELNPALDLIRADYSLERLSCGTTRSTESYLIAVQRSGRQKPLLYWPREGHLQKQEVVE